MGEANQLGPEMVLTIGRQVQETARAARARGEFVQPGAVTRSGYRILARALMSDEVGERRDLWAVQAPDGGNAIFLVTGTHVLVPRPLGRTEVERLLEVCRVRVAEMDALLAAARAAEPSEAGPSGARHLTRVVDADWLRASRWSEERRGSARLRLLDGQPVEVEGAVLLEPAAKAAETTVRARRLGELARVSDPMRMADDLLARSVWLRPLDTRVWRRGRLLLEPGRVGFVDEPEADDGTPREVLALSPFGKTAGHSLEADLFGCPAVRRKARASGTYATLLHAALQGRRWHHRTGAWSGGRSGTRPVDLLLAQVAGEEDPDSLARVIGSVDLLDEVVLADARALGWEPVP